jgi:hypothetical protein
MIDSGLGRVDGRDAYTKVTIAKPAWMATRLVRRGRSTDEVELARARWKRQHAARSVGWWLMAGAGLF